MAHTCKVWLLNELSYSCYFLGHWRVEIWKFSSAPQFCFDIGIVFPYTYGFVREFVSL